MSRDDGRPEFPRRGTEMTRLETFRDAAFEARDCAGLLIGIVIGRVEARHATSE